MTKPVHHTYKEIVSQTTAWAQALEVTRALGVEIAHLWEGDPDFKVIFTGCGSTYYLSLAAAALFVELTGRDAKAVPAGELYLYPQNHYQPGASTLLIAVSRSGTTSETVAVVQRFRDDKRGPVIVITNYGTSPLAGLGDISIEIPAGQEHSVAQTCSFASMYVACVALAAQVAGRTDWLDAAEGLPQVGDRLLETCEPLAKSIGGDLDLDRFYFLGSGPRYGLACETNLKMKEMTLTHSEPFHFMEFRHGPMSMVTGTTVVLGLRSSSNALHEQAVLDEMEVLGARVISVAESGADLSFSSGLPEQVQNVLYLPPLQLMAYYRSLAKGLNPDNPQHLNAVVELNLA